MIVSGATNSCAGARTSRGSSSSERVLGDREFLIDQNSKLRNGEDGPSLINPVAWNSTAVKRSRGEHPSLTETKGRAERGDSLPPTSS